MSPPSDQNGTTAQAAEARGDLFEMIANLAALANRRGEKAIAVVTWPNRRETLITTVLVVVMCGFASLVLCAADQGIHLLITFILGLGH